MKQHEKRHLVSLVRYERPHISVQRAVDLCHGLDHLPSNPKVFIKPNLVFWSRHVPFPAWGVITTSRVVEDMVLLLKERGVEHIIIGEGMVLMDTKDTQTPAHAFETLGYGTLKQRYGVQAINVHERPFKKVTFGDGTVLKVNADLLEQDFLVNLPILKTHAQTIVSLGIKNLKGLLDMGSRKICHSPDPRHDLNERVARLLEMAPPGLTLIDGIYSSERGPGFDGKMHRTNVLIASPDMLSADKVGAQVLGYSACDVPHLARAASLNTRPDDLSDVQVAGEPIEALTKKHQYLFPYTEDDALPLPMKRMGIQGLSYRKYDLTMCTYCSVLNGLILTGIAQAWNGKPWDDVEVLTGKIMKPSPGKKNTILVGKCMYQAHKENPDIQKMIPVKGCPPSTKKIIEAFHEAGIPLNHAIFDAMDQVPGLFMKRYQGRPEFEESHFRIL